MIELYFVLLGIAAGILSGLFGIGGGIVMVPSLILLFGMNILDANATSLAAMLLPVGILGVIAYHKAGLLNVKEALWIAGGLFIGSFFGGELAVHINETVLAYLYIIILFYIAISYLDLPVVFKNKQNKPKDTTDNRKSIQKPFIAFVIVGIAAGIFAGLFGKGGGIVIVPILISLFNYEPKAATATSLAALQLPVGLPSVLIYANEGHLNISFAAFIAAGIVIGAFIGSKIGVKLPSKSFKKVYALFVFTVAIYMITKYI